MGKFLPLVLLAGAAIYFFAQRGKNGAASATAPARRAAPRVRPRIPGNCGAILEPSEPTPADCAGGTCPLRRAQAAELSTFGDLATWVDCAASAGSLSDAQVRKGVVADESALASLRAGDPDAWSRVRADINAAIQQQGASAMPGSASLQYVAGGTVRTVQLERSLTGDLQLVYTGPLTTGWRLYPQLGAMYGMGFWG